VDTKLHQCTINMIDVQGDRALVRPVGDLDGFTGPPLGAMLSQVARRGVRHFTIDMSLVTFADSGAIHSIEHLLRDHPETIVTLVGTSDVFRTLLTVSGLDAHLGLVS